MPGRKDPSILQAEFTRYAGAMRLHLHYLLADGFDPDTAELALRVGLLPEGGEGPEMLRLKLTLGWGGDPLQNLRRELQTHVQVAIPAGWERGLKTIIHAIEEELATPQGRNPGRYTWVQTQVFHPADDRRSTLGHSVQRQADIVWDWAQRMEQQGHVVRAIEFLERLLLLAPHHSLALERLAALLRSEGMVEESLPLLDRLISLRPDDLEPRIRKGEALLHLERPEVALEVFQGVLRAQPLHALAHIGAAQARGHLGGDPLPHLDAAIELDREATLSILRETFDHRILKPLPHATSYPLEDLPALLGVTHGELRALVLEHNLPVTQADGSVREPELSRWVMLQNRYQLLPFALSWLAPTPRHLPELP